MAFQFPASPVLGQIFTPVAGVGYRWNGTGWSPLTPTVSQVSIPVACSDEITAITTGTAKTTFRMPHAFTLSKIKASLTVASTSGLVTLDVNKNGVSLFSTLLTIDVNEKTSVTAATAAVLTTIALADDDEITVDFDAAGTGAKGVKIYLVGIAS
jgi:hypothetical protein